MLGKSKLIKKDAIRQLFKWDFLKRNIPAPGWGTGMGNLLGGVLLRCGSLDDLMQETVSVGHVGAAVADSFQFLVVADAGHLVGGGFIQKLP